MCFPWRSCLRYEGLCCTTSTCNIHFIQTLEGLRRQWWCGRRSTLTKSLDIVNLLVYTWIKLTWARIFWKLMLQNGSSDLLSQWTDWVSQELFGNFAATLIEPSFTYSPLFIFSHWTAQHISDFMLRRRGSSVHVFQFTTWEKGTHVDMKQVWNVSHMFLYRHPYDPDVDDDAKMSEESSSCPATARS